MRNRTLLSLIEMLIMVMVFTVSAAICLKAFVYAGQTSRSTQEEAEAAVRAQSAAELMQHFAGDMQKAAEVYGGAVGTDGVWTAAFDGDWELLEAPAGVAYYMETEAGDDADAYLGEGSVTVRNAAGEVLFGIPVCWQKGAAGSQAEQTEDAAGSPEEQTADEEGGR